MNFRTFSGQKHVFRRGKMKGNVVYDALFQGLIFQIGPTGTCRGGSVVSKSVSQYISTSQKHDSGNTNKKFFIYTNKQGICNKIASQKTTELLNY